MTQPLDWDRISDLLGRALDLPAAECRAFLDRECGDDPELRAELESLLEAAAQSPDFLSRLARDVMGPAAEEMVSAERDETADEWIGRAIGSYQVRERIGRGGMATVYLAHDPKHNRNVAIKVLRPELAATLGVERFLREIEIAAQLTHPHMLPLFDSGEDQGVLYYVMPYVEGESLRDRLEREKQLPLADAIRLTEQIASALTYAHERGIIHRDIKPGNILLSGDQASVADFGIARAVEAAGGDRITGTGLAIGTPAYMSPEQAMGTSDVSASTDVYALGCVVYEMVSGRAPFEGPTPQALLSKHVADSVPALRSVNPSLPLFVERAVERALAKQPSHRFPSANAFAQALSTGSVVARVPNPRQKRRTLRVAGGAVLLAATWGAVSLLGGSSIQRLAVLPLTNLTNDTSQQYLVEGVHEALIAELAQLGLSVIARTTMRQYQDTDKPIREIAQELGVQAVIEGSIFRAGDSLEIAARLYRGDDEREIWNGSYDGDLPNAVALYRAFARTIAEQVRLKLRPEVSARLAQATRRNPEVYEAYLKGMYYLNQSTEEDFEHAMGYFQEAMEKNPADPLAYVGLAFAYITLGHGPAPPPDAWRRGRAAAERALRLDSTLAEAWAALADIKTYLEWDWENAEHAFQRADELNPSMAMNHYHRAWYLIMHGRLEEALASHRRAQELDPLTPLHTVWLPGVYLYGGRYRQALEEARKVVQRYPDNAVALFVLGTSAAQVGEYEEAIAAHEKAATINPRWRFALGRSYALAGRTKDARRILAELEAERPTSWGAIGLADLHTALGNHDEAFKWLNYEPAHGWLPWSRVNPALVPLRGDPRFEELMRMMNLPSPDGS